MKEQREQLWNLRPKQEPIVGNLPDLPGIGVGMGLSPRIGFALRSVAQEALVTEYPGSTLTRSHREELATRASAGNNCMYCTESHGAFACGLMLQEDPTLTQEKAEHIIESIKDGNGEELDPKMQALMKIVDIVRENALNLTEKDVERALECGATNQDVHLAIFISSAFAMYNRIVDGFRAVTPANPEDYKKDVPRIIENGYLPPSQK